MDYFHEDRAGAKPADESVGVISLASVSFSTNEQYFLLVYKGFSLIHLCHLTPLLAPSSAPETEEKHIQNNVHRFEVIQPTQKPKPSLVPFSCSE